MCSATVSTLPRRIQGFPNTLYMPLDAIEIAPISTPLSTYSSNLMPFHIDYSGPAPISTYFRVWPSPSNVAAPSSLDVETNTTITVTQSTAKAGEDSDLNFDEGVAAGAEPHPDTDLPSSEEPVSPEATRFISAFRGRTVHGLKVNLPEGYGGVILRANSNEGSAQAVQRSTAKGVEAVKLTTQLKSSRKGRATRNSSRAAEMEAGDNAGIASASEDVGDLVDEEAAARILKPTASFSSFVLWQPDNPVDEARDEYFRSLTEWTGLASHRHHFEES